MIEKIVKRNGTIAKFEPIKIANSLHKVMLKNDPEADFSRALQMTDEIVEELEQVLEGDSNVSIPSIEYVDDTINEYLMSNKQTHRLAVAYIIHRDEKKKLHKPDIFKLRKTYKPFEYPQFKEYVNAIRQSYWIHDEFDYTSDIQDFRINMSGAEREATRRAMLAISHIESTVKLFWTKLGDFLPKPEIYEAGISMGESEVRHASAYSELLELLGLNDDFKEIMNIPVIRKRQEYMDRALSGDRNDPREFMESVLLFSLFIENVSLFSQFLIIMALNADKGYLKGMSNAVAATALEENIHAMLGAEIIRIIRDEHPEWFDDSLTARVHEMVHQSFEAEKEIVEWIFEKGEIESISLVENIEYMKNRYNSGMKDAGFKPVFSVDEKLLERSEFFDIQVATTTHVDFFHKRSVNYTKRKQSFDADALF